MDALTKYIFFNYGHLMNFKEKVAYKSVLGQGKLEHSQSEGMQRILLKHWISLEPEVVELLRDGSERFMIGVSERILREEADRIYLNYCPRCGALARTPQARQCPKCFRSWHGAV